jgi:hypothetical protein
MAKTKITVKIHEKMFQAFEKQMDALHLKRDAFLDSVIQEEVKYLADELKGKRQSPAARQYIAGELKRLGTRQVNIQVEQSTADELNRVIADGNIVRDAFINRLIMFLRSTPTVLNALGLPLAINNSEYEDGVEPMATSPLTAMEEVHSQPLYYIREAIQERHGVGLYELLLPSQLIGFSCYLEDSFVPGTEAYKAAQNSLDDLLFDLGSDIPKKSESTHIEGGAS